jgi:hypothetical protein
MSSRKPEAPKPKAPDRCTKPQNEGPSKEIERGREGEGEIGREIREREINWEREREFGFPKADFKQLQVVKPTKAQKPKSLISKIGKCKKVRIPPES